MNKNSRQNFTGSLSGSQSIARKLRRKSQPKKSMKHARHHDEDAKSVIISFGDIYMEILQL